MRTNIRRPLFGGTREIDALWFDLDLLGEAEARRRILAHWQAGARLHQAGGGYLLTLARARWGDCAAFDGLPLCRVDGILSSAPLALDERDAIPRGGCALVRGAQAHAIALTDANLVDAAAWIDVGAIVLRAPLQPPAGNVRVALDAPEESKSVREILDHAVGPPSDERDAFLRAARSAAGNQQAPGWSRAARMAGVTLAKAALIAVAAVGLVPLLLAGLIKGAGGEAGKQVGGKAGADGAAAESARAAPDAPWKQRLDAAVARLAGLTGLSKLIGRSQAAYLRKLVEMFEEGDVAEALRHAIPLGGDHDTQRQAMGALRARAKLDITGPGGTAAVIGLDPSLEQYLSEKYRKLFQRLEREGRIDEATFVLAELLKCGVEAVDYLERNGRLRQAAQLAEKLALAPEIAVRLSIMAGDAPRAVRIARLTGAFGEAVRLLERKQSPEAGPLRALWAEYLADRGDLCEAADAIWPLEAYRSLALKWLVQAEQAGRMPGVRALVRKLALMPESLADSLPAIGALLERQGDDAAALRASLASELLALDPHSGATRRLAGEVLRHVIPERAAARNALTKSELTKLLNLADGAMFKSDLPPLDFGKTPSGNQVTALTAPLVVHGGARALLQIHDARRLPDGHYLLALGENGVIRINARGKQLVHFPLPAFHLVLATNGERALALARRGDVVRASRIDLTTCKVSDWLSHPMDAWAAQFDGVIWNAVIDNRIVAIDTSKDQLAVIWQVADLPGKVIEFLDDGTLQLILMANHEQLHLWRYHLPARRLGQRDSVPFAPPDVAGVLLHPHSQEPVHVRLRNGGQEPTLVIGNGDKDRAEVALGDSVGEPRVVVQDTWVLVQTRTGDGGYRCQVVYRAMSRVVADLRLEDAHEPGVRAQGDHVLVFDRAGRLLDLDMETRVVVSLSLS